VARRLSLTIDKPKPIALIRKTRPEVVRAVDELLEIGTDQQVAARLNELGYRNWRGQSFTVKKVIVIRKAYGLRSRFERLRERGMLTGDEVARQLGVCTTTIHQWGRAISTATITAACTNPSPTSSWSRGLAGAMEASCRPSSPLHQPHKVQYEVFALVRAR